ncbi:MAG: hypothetical protein JSU06_14195 [Actinobacteria bacterium]|nr:hypothetical protein [Actinomycetota bacterium]
MAFILSRIDVGDYETWEPLFDQDGPGTRRDALGYRLFRGSDDPNEVFIQVEFDSTEKAQAARRRLLASGALERFPDRTGPTVAEEVETVRAD